MKPIEIDIALQQVTGFTKDELLQKTKVKDIAEARQLGMVFYVLNGSSFRFAAESFGKKHPTALSTLKTVRRLYSQEWECDIRFKINELCRLTGLRFNQTKYVK